MREIGKIGHFGVLTCFLPKLNTHAAQMTHVLRKHLPVPPFAYYLLKNAAKMNVTNDPRGMFERDGGDPIVYGTQRAAQL